MIIGFDAKRYFGNQTGLGNYSRFIIKTFADFFPENKYILYNPENISGLSKPLKIAVPKYLNAFYAAIWRSGFLTKDLIRDNVNIYHGLSNELPFTIKKFKGIKVVTIHDMIYKYYPEWYPVIDRNLYYMKARKSVQSADYIIAVSQFTAQSILDFFPECISKVRVIGQDCHPIFSEPFNEDKVREVKKRYNTGNSYILLVSKTETRKNHRLIVESWIKSGLGNKGYKLILAGRRGNTENIINSLMNKDNSISRIVDIPIHDLPALYEGALLSIYPSIMEGFGIPVLESIRRNCPVMVSSLGCAGEVAGKSGIYINIESQGEIIEELENYIENVNYQNQLRNQCSTEALKFNREKIIREINKLYLGEV